MKLLVALGGNMISDAKIKGEPYEDQLKKIENTAKLLLELIKKGNDIVITHGNGPQVGSLLLQQQANIEGSTRLPLSILNALTQGQIGVALQHALINQLRESQIEKQVIVLPTTVIVDADDPGFTNPSKPVGPFTTSKIEVEDGQTMGYSYVEKQEGYRRVVPSPIPRRILEADLVQEQLNEGNVVIAVGGGGVPTIIQEGELKMVDAVIDKDLASSVLARQVGVERMIILTNVEGVFQNYGQANQKLILNLGLDEAGELLSSNANEMKGSMGPKIKACIEFGNHGHQSIITSPDKLLKAILGEAGTTIS